MEKSAIARSHGAERRHSLALALPVARYLLQVLAPCCERIEIAGSIRRLKPTVGDIELVCVPRVVIGPPDLLGKPQWQVSILDEKLLQLAQRAELRPRVNAEGRNVGYGPLNKYMLHVPTGIPVDLFVTTKENWGMALVVRTGPKDFNTMLFATLRWSGYEGHAYAGVTAPGTAREIGCPDEQTVFNLAGWPYVQPEQREMWKPASMMDWRARA